MKMLLFSNKLCCVLFTLLFATSVYAQETHINVFSDKGERFWVIINGIKQNTKASQHVKVTKLAGEFWKMRVVFENQNIPEISQNVGTMEKNQELTYQVKQNRKGEYVVRPFSMTAITNGTVETTVPYHASEITEKQPDNNPTIDTKTGFSLKVNEKGFDVKVNINDNNQNIKMQEITNDNIPNFNPDNTNNNINRSNICWQATNDNDFQQAKKAVEAEAFEENKIKVAKQFMKNNCLSVIQIEDIMASFSFEDNKLEYAKYAYDFCVDKKNYYQLNSAFAFNDSKDALDAFLKTK